VAITAVLLAVFVPSALQSGSTGIIYRQFALTIAMSMFLSAFLALTLTPALCAAWLRPTHDRPRNAFYRGFNRLLDWTRQTYVGHIAHAVRHAPRWMMVFVLVAALAGFLYVRLPGSFLPAEDQGYVLVMVQLPQGATKERSQVVMKKVQQTLAKNPDVAHVMQIIGFSPVGSGENNAMAFVQLRDWSERPTSVEKLIPQLNNELRAAVRDAYLVVVNLPTVRGLGQFGGFDLYLQDRGGLGRAALEQAQQTVVERAAENEVLVNVRPNELPPAPQLDFRIDRVQAASMGLSASDVANAASLMMAPTNVGQMFAEGRVKFVMLQAAAPHRMDETAFDDFYTPSSTRRNADGTPAMIPIGSVIEREWNLVSPSRVRFNGNPAIEIVGDAAPGFASGQAMTAVQQIIEQHLPRGFGFDWTGQSFQEVVASSGTTMLMALSILVVFLALAALYESWSVPVTVLLIVPLALLGTVAFTMGRGLANDVFFKIGLVTVIGLAAKNAILIVEFAVAAQAEGKSLREAVLTAARLRFRPILMTSFAFILGMFPLAVSTGAGANARHAIGTGVIGGMLFATLFGLLLIPVFYVIVRRLVGDRLDGPASAANGPAADG